MKLMLPLRWLVAIALAQPLFAQQGGFIDGVVRDRFGGMVAGAEVRIQNELTGARQKTYSDGSGEYVTSELAEGAYKITVRNEGFRTITQSGITVQAGKTLSVNFIIDLLPLQQEVTVEATQNSSDPTASGLAVTRESYPQSSLPANGRDVHALFPIMPGAIVTPASIGGGGQFTVGGQRPNTNSYRVDGVSGSAGVGVISIPGAFPGASLPGMTTIGSMQSLASKEETQRVDLQSSGFAPQSGDRPGAQIAIETRSGTNEFHGSAFSYVRPHWLDSRDWFARRVGSDLPSAFVAGWGGGVGGPIWRNHTFFFASFERAEVHDSALQLIAAPSLEARNAAKDGVQQILSAFPLPTGPALNSVESLTGSPLQKTATISNRSLRLDQALGSKVQFFARYSNVPSLSTAIELGTARSQFRWVSATGGLNIATTSLTQEIRFNYTQVASISTHEFGVQSDQPGVYSISQALARYFFQTDTPPFYHFWLVTELSIAGVGRAIAGQSGVSTQHQWNSTYSLARSSGRHDFRLGADYVRVVPSNGVPSATLSVVAPGTKALLDGAPLGLTIANFPAYSVGMHKASVFGQHDIRIGERFNLLYGLRWEITPPLFFSNSADFPFVGNWGGLGTLPVQLGSIYSADQSRWPMRYNQFAPRIGMAYHLKSPDVVWRAGAGVFYDTALAAAIDPVSVNPLNSWQFSPVMTANAGAATPFTAPSPALYLPRVLEWRTSIEKSLRPGAVLSAAYLGSAGRNLLRKEATLAPQTGLLQSLGFTSHGNSDYEALQIQFSGNVTPRFYSLVSYIWGHSIDKGSSDQAVFLVHPGYNDTVDRGSSSFDVRQAFAASLGYRLHGWNLSATVQARAGFPFDVTTIDRSIGLGFDNTGRADLVKGVPVWVRDRAAPGGRILNPAAFRSPADSLDGTLGRNVLRGSGLFQIDASLRRQFRLVGRSSLEASISAFNVVNQPSFANPVSYLSSSLFGQSTSMGSLMLGAGSPTTGLTPVFQAGGPRTVELGFRFTF